MTEYFDALEVRDQAQREADLFAALPAALTAARERAPAIASQLQDVQVDRITSRQALAGIPVLRKSELLQRQQAQRRQAIEQRAQAGTAAGKVVERVFGGFSTIGWGDAARVFASPGPLYEPESKRADYWRFGRALYAAGFRANTLLYNCFSYHFTPAGSMFETAGLAIGCTVFPGGVGQTEMQVSTIHDLQPEGYAGTPSFLKLILEKADEMQIALPSLKRALFSGEAFPPSLQNWFAQRGIHGYQAYGTADLGLIAYESEARDGLIIGEDIVLEIVRPGTNEPVPDGEVGEIVVTTLNPDYPLLRFGTGDLSAIMPGHSACGRTNKRIRGWMGRADQTTKVRGMFVHPEQVARIVARFEEVNKARLVVSGETGRDEMTLFVEVDGAPAAGLQEKLGNVVREETKLRAVIVFVGVGELANDGKVIEDSRSYE
ncbi:phenylacetate--CoA ligase family protein [Advenella mimigardefordensis]|uniref:Putative phenylacetate-CoA ligase n=1 Tax=Advenella mimigardefordensis (strain DSM 17166 / LMG 22922 / DPN7) TaxID=1247726 RepID=W0PCQ5_ADVMD|nr:AMP-binding protein [Advenella mimigardefordensis]AHG62808.1 putative phenylacetate-CoA ligase [Advenella mimigardefordensis DPN7]